MAASTLQSTLRPPEVHTFYRNVPICIVYIIIIIISFIVNANKRRNGEKGENNKHKERETTISSSN